MPYNESRTKGSDMGIRVSCPNGHKLNVKEQLAGKRGICPVCRATFDIPSAGELRPAEPAAIVSGGAVVHASNTGVHVAPAAKSVVIPVVEPVLTAAAAISPPPSLAVTSSEAPQAQQAPPSAPIAIHSQVSVSEALESPSARFIAKRMRSRRNQTTLAIALLVAVILLAGLLIWVLSRRPADSGDVAQARISNATDMYYAIAAAYNAASALTSEQV
jgi:hypothetical protein